MRIVYPVRYSLVKMAALHCNRHERVVDKNDARQLTARYCWDILLLDLRTNDGRLTSSGLAQQRRGRTAAAEFRDAPSPNNALGEHRLRSLLGRCAQHAHAHCDSPACVQIRLALRQRKEAESGKRITERITRGVKRWKPVAMCMWVIS